ncbi:hypothetical protein P6P90_12800 [Ectobacillus antri]|uniref:DUF1700 domain-containing protein n=1 Tax=Ectobacillus antri TaxID=2486280 RepID=A0ABT6H6H4_9BACI|nr:hypothetical protein [Ectobacillus antri]MDG4657771.1 hypothetical protein [Ectobacillus antri]MDG5754839.1 hypothetical protein [Ectobacillus antri]
MKKNSINKFLQSLDKELSCLSNSERNNYIKEFTDHLFSLIEDKKAQGLSEKEAIESSLNEFPDPKVIAHDYIRSNETKLTYLPTDGMDFKFRYKSALIVMGLVELVLLLTDRGLNLYLGAVGLVMLIFGNIMVVKHRNWNKDNIKQLFWVNIGTWTCLPLGLFFFFRRDDIDNFTIGYIFVLILLIVTQHFVTQKILKNKNPKITFFS